ncbi:MAG TPA: DUF2252 family protein [Candidatus Dormibacteraeota bacterium]|jgi:hypothetical protein|nr:DUF2252 family protein [Candidatus Dormibacteraeota bacterium]
MRGRAAGAEIVARTAAYERWLGRHTRVVQADIERKHRLMAADPLGFLRGTFYRWAEVLPALCPEAVDGPEVLGVGDLHVQNFGTWRDVEARLVWGVNDFDEATRLPYANDLVRLATSARLAILVGHLGLRFRDACRAILAGYTDSVTGGGRPVVLAENDRWLRRLALNEERDPVVYWERMRHLPPPPRPVPATVVRALRRRLPPGAEEIGLYHRVAGVGSLGRQRTVALGDIHGLVAREAKPVLASAWGWAGGTPAPNRYAEVLAGAVRCPDPEVRVAEGLVVRRLAPDCSRVSLGSLPVRRDEERLLRAMGWETANVHLGTPGAADPILADLAARPSGWLRRAARTMTEATWLDWRAWRESAVSHGVAGEPGPQA